MLSKAESGWWEKLWMKSAIDKSYKTIIQLIYVLFKYEFNNTKLSEHIPI